MGQPRADSIRPAFRAFNPAFHRGGADQFQPGLHILDHPRSGSATIPLRARADRLAVAGVRLFDDSFIDFLIRTGAEFAEAEGPYAVRDNLPAYHQSESARSFAGDRRADRVG